MISFEVQSAQFEGAMLKKIDGIGLSAQKVLRDEAGKLAATLIKISGGKINSVKRNITRRVEKSFVELQPNRSPHKTDKPGESGVQWLGSTSGAIYGVDQEMDYTGADLKKLSEYLVSKKTRPKWAREGRRGKQAVWIVRRAYVKHSQLAELKRIMLGHIGRRQAGWVKAWKHLGSPIVGNPIPTQVLRNAEGARGTFADGLSIKDAPEFTLINQAAGSSKLREICKRALQIRTKAMLADLALYIRGVKKPVQYSHLR